MIEKFTADRAIELLTTEGARDDRYACDDVLASADDVHDLIVWLIGGASEGQARRELDFVSTLRALVLSAFEAGVRVAEKVYEVQR